MKAMIFAAGLGSRLKPFTSQMPKALVPVAGIPMLEILIKHLKKNNVNEIIINTHHFANQVKDFLEQNNNFDCEIAISDESDLLLDTGGGLQKALWFFNDNQPFLVQNVDVLSNINYSQMLVTHNKANALATLAVSNRASSRYLLFDQSMQLCGWENVSTQEVKMSVDLKSELKRFAFSGIHILNPIFFKHLTLNGKFSMIDAYLSTANSCRIIGFEHNPDFWVDMGKPKSVLHAEAILSQMPDYF